MGNRRAEKNRRRQERKARKVKRAPSGAFKDFPNADNNERTIHHFVGVTDHAPADQVNPHDPDDAWYVQGMITAGSRGYLERFVKAVKNHSGSPDFVIRKWNEPRTKRRKEAYQALFMTGFSGALRESDLVTVVAFATQKHLIVNQWTSYLQSGKVPNTVELLSREDGTLAVKFNQVKFTKNGKEMTTTIEMDWKRAAVVLWQVRVLNRLYTRTTQQIGIQPYWSLIADRHPGDAEGLTLGLILQMLQSRVGSRMKITCMDPDDTEDPEIEKIADCFATWVREAKMHPNSLAATNLKSLQGDPALARRLGIETQRPKAPIPHAQSTLAEDPTTTGPSVSPTP